MNYNINNLTNSFAFLNVQPNQMPVKIYFNNGEIRRFKINFPTNLKQLVLESLKQLQEKNVDTTKFRLFYEDMDGDWVNMDTEEEFVDALNNSLGPALKLKVDLLQFEKKQEVKKEEFIQPQKPEEKQTEPHVGICCDSCHKQNFFGKRYQCLSCSDYDLCESCFPSRDTFHAKNHPFKLINKPAEVVKQPELIPIKPVLEPVEPHTGIACDNCKKQNFTGKRFQCTQCDDFDLCEDCFPKRSNFHSNNHPFKLIAKPIKVNPIQPIKPVEPIEVHKGVACDNCSKQNFTGRRYKCLTCSDYDLCESCYQIRFQFHTQFHQFKRILVGEPEIPIQKPIYPVPQNFPKNIKR
eukprot:gene9234-1320_t